MARRAAAKVPPNDVRSDGLGMQGYLAEIQGASADRSPEKTGFGNLTDMSRHV